MTDGTEQAGAKPKSVEAAERGKAPAKQAAKKAAGKPAKTQTTAPAAVSPAKATNEPAKEGFFARFTKSLAEEWGL
ncbi:MAG TPA: hypothetical protein VGH19_16065 [Verrucomicrobiae bacterium]